MEARLGAEAHHFYGNNKRNLDWDLNDWKWDGDLFIATPVNRRVGKELFPLNSGVPAAGNSSNSSSSYSDEVDLGIERAKRELEKRRRVVVEDSNLNDDAGTLTLKLGGHGSSLVVGAREGGTWDGTSGKRGKVCNRAVCQVDGCAADLSNAKDYHRRHKVCEMHSKASKALVGNAMQRFCQQCSRFHVLQEFDEGKRSCRRRLAGHNKRRRKTNPETVVNGASLNDNQTSNYLLISLLRILSGMHSNRTDKAIDQNLVSHLVRSLANQSAEHGRTSEIISALLSNGPQDHPKPIDQHLPVSEMPQQHLHLDDIRDGEMRTTSSQTHSVLHSPPSSEARQTSSGETKINKFDLNDVYIDSDDCMDDIDRSLVPANIGTSSIDCPSWAQQDSHQSSPPQTSGNSDSASAQSPSSSTGHAQSRTDRIVFKLFGKEPNDFPLVLRAQILDWLSQSPTDIESYIRPGCIVLTIYLRQTDAAWEELCCDLSYSLSRLLDTGSDTFWRSGWIYARVQHQMAFIHEGQVAIDTSLVTNSNYCDILSVKPIAVSSCEKVQFSVKGINLSQPSTRLLCALEGRYLEPNAAHDFQDSDDSINDHDELQCVKLSCSIPEVIGRGFIEVEDNGLSSSFFPFIVAEEDVCAEIRMLEGALDITESETDNFESGEMKAKDQALEFIHEMGWLLHRTQLKPKLGHSIPKADLFSLKRFKWLMEFSMDHDWCAVVKKLLDVFLNGTVGPGEHPSTYMALSDMGLLHRAVRRNSRALVELLLRYVPQKDSKEPGSENNASVGEGYDTFLFRPDVAGPAGLTPLHIAAGKDGSEEVLDALTDDPGRVGVEAWKNTRDSTGFTPEDYARLRGQYSYIHLIQRKINKSTAGHVVLDIPDVPSDSNNKQKENTDLKASFEIGQPHMEPIKRNCNLCNKKFAYRTSNRSLVYRPAMLSMVAVAAVCVCVALLFKSSPEVLYVFEPFRWERLHYGTI